MYYSSHDCHNGSGLNMMGQQNDDTGQGYNAVPAQRVGNEHGSDGNGQLGILATKRGHIKVPQYLAQYPEIGTLGKDDYSEDMSHTQEIFRNVIEEQCYKIQEFNTHSLWVQNQVTNEFQQRHCQQLHEVKQSLHDLDRKKIHEYKQSDLNIFLDTPIKFQEIENEGELHWRNVIKTNERDWNRFLDG